MERRGRAEGKSNVDKYQKGVRVSVKITVTATIRDMWYGYDQSQG